MNVNQKQQLKDEVLTMNFYYNDKLMRTSQTENYKFALLFPNGGCEKAAPTRRGLEKMRAKEVDGSKSYYDFWEKRKQYFLDHGEVKKGGIAECEKHMAQCKAELDWYSDTTQCIVPVEAR